MGSVLTSSLKEDKCRQLCRFEHFKRSYENFILTDRIQINRIQL